ncbi:MAG: DegT/DnrJ/EryC1/StrS family aminotransferase [Candidatus Hydrogenedentes bacterium]|nr:DegT/DnrJ/EryC1/StrS family aminotransferase [Candidatus Hydrogenedentota bacterium]
MRTADLIQHSAPVIGDEEVEAVSRVLYSGCIAQGPEVEAFEEECAAFIGRRHAVAVSSGTAALHLALNALGVDERSTVAAPSYACASLLTAISLQRAKPYLCDVGPDFNLDTRTLPQEVDATIVPHLFGAPAQVPPGPAVIEDIAQSFGGPTGSHAPLAITSFYATKMMTTGEGGMVLTDDEAIAEHVRDRRDYDNREDFRDRFNYKLTDIQAALGRVQLNRLPSFIARRREIAAQYLVAFRDLPLELPKPRGHVFYRFVVSTNLRDKLEEHLQTQGIEAKRPVHRPAHHYLKNGDLGKTADGQGSYPGSERAHKCALSLPIHPNMLDEDVEGVVDSVREFY